jgi:hypothetical protein
MTDRCNGAYLETRATRDEREPLTLDDPEMLYGWRNVPVPPDASGDWFIVDSTNDKATTWARWRADHGEGNA